MTIRTFSRIFSVLAAVLIFSFGATSFASMPAVDRFEDAVPAIQGTWYDLDGNEAFVIVGDSFNGRKILSATNRLGSTRNPSAEFCIEGENGEEPSYLDIVWMSNGRFIMVDGINYRSTKEPTYFESARGVFLGMKQEDMLALLGEPTKSEANCNFIFPDMSVKTVGGMVHAIFLPSGGARLDGSGLGADSAPEEFMAAYGLDEPLGNKNREIGTCGEKLKLLNIRPKTLLLSFSDT